MCIGIPGQVVAVSPEAHETATVAVQGANRTISLALLDGAPPEPGDWVVIQLGFALERLTEEEAAEATRLLDVLTGSTADDLLGDYAAAAVPARSD
jgi:hydrogenase expression/formation protein HypC